VTVGNVLTANITGLPSETSVTFTVSAINSFGGSSNTPVSPPVIPTGRPSSVLGVSGVPGVASALISWSPPLSNGGSPITGYKVLCVPDNKKPNLVGPNDRSLVITGLKNGALTTCTVVAINAAGQSDSVSFTPNPLPGVPKVTAVRGASGAINLSWTANPANLNSPITGYAVSLVSPLPAPAGMIIPTPTVTPTGGSVSVLGLTNGNAYVFSVKSVSIIGQSVGGLSKVVTAAALPDAPTSFVGTKGVASAGLSWVAPTNTGGLPLTGYIITYTLAGVVKTVALKLVTSAIIKGLVNGTSYSFTIQAITLAGASAQSSPVTVTPGLGL
jgi:titin